MFLSSGYPRQSIFFLLFLASFNTHDGMECKDDKEDEKRENKCKPGKQENAVTISTHVVDDYVKRFEIYLSWIGNGKKDRSSKDHAALWR